MTKCVDDIKTEASGRNEKIKVNSGYWEHRKNGMDLFYCGVSSSRETDSWNRNE